jgi:hypothetical protein
MSLNFVTGYSTDLQKAKEFAIHFYNEREGRKRFEAVESQTGENEIGNQVWVTTIWYTELGDPVEPQKQEEKFEFIGSTDVDPRDPDWREKLYGDMNESGVVAEPIADPNLVTVAATPTVAFEVHHVEEVES